MFGLMKSKNVVGLDIGASSVKAVQLKRGRGGNELVSLGIAPLPPETIVDGVIMDSGTVIAAIQNIFTEQKIKTKDVVVAVSGHSVIVKKIRVPGFRHFQVRFFYFHLRWYFGQFQYVI